MNYRCPLSQVLKNEAVSFVEFANGGAQATVELKDGRKFEKALVSNGAAIVAVRGYDTPPFEPEEIASIYQTENDRDPEERGGWRFWDEWRST